MKEKLSGLADNNRFFAHSTDSPLRPPWFFFEKSFVIVQINIRKPFFRLGLLYFLSNLRHGIICNVHYIIEFHIENHDARYFLCLLRIFITVHFWGYLRAIRKNLPTTFHSCDRLSRHKKSFSKDLISNEVHRFVCNPTAKSVLLVTF